MAEPSFRPTPLASELEDEFIRLKEAHQAQACIYSLVSPHQQAPEQPEEFSATPENLRALLRVTQAEMERRAGAVGTAIGVLREVLG